MMRFGFRQNHPTAARRRAAGRAFAVATAGALALALPAQANGDLASRVQSVTERAAAEWTVFLTCSRNQADLHEDLVRRLDRMVRISRSILGEAGAPLCGERIYDRPLNGAPVADESGAARPLLHAFRLGIEHPDGNEFMGWEADPPPDFTAVVARLRSEAGKTAE